MVRKEHTRNQRRMYRIHKQDERIHDLELLVGELRQENNKIKEVYEQVFADYQKQKEIIDKAIEYIEKNKHLNWYTESCYTKELLDILNGEDKEVSE